MNDRIESGLFSDISIISPIYFVVGSQAYTAIYYFVDHNLACSLKSASFSKFSAHYPLTL